MRIVPGGDLELVWGQIHRWIERAVEHGQGDEDSLDIAIAIYHGKYNLWLEDGKFAAVVQIIDYPQQKVATILYCGGELESLLTMYQEAKRYAKEIGVNVIRVWGREGWQKVLGMKRVGVILQERV